MVVAIVGSRKAEDESVIRGVLDKLEPGTEVVSGGQPKGVDGIVDELLRREAPYKNELKYTVFPPKHYSPDERGWSESTLGEDLSEYGQEYEKVHYRDRTLDICLVADKMVAIKKRGAENRGTGIAIRMFEEVNDEEPLVTWV